LTGDEIVTHKLYLNSGMEAWWWRASAALQSAVAV
jgi:hypothetical protein